MGKFASYVSSVEKTLDQVSSIPKTLHVKVFLFALILQLTGVFAQILLANQMNIEIPLSTIIWIRSVALLAGYLPLSFAGLGVREFGLAYLLNYYGVPQATSVSYSFILLATIYVIGLIGGLNEIFDHTGPIKAGLR